jgi:hypothetical protein
MLTQWIASDAKGILWILNKEMHTRNKAYDNKMMDDVQTEQQIIFPSNYGARIISVLSELLYATL